MTNYTSGHETKAGGVGTNRLAFPENHIEADNRLSWYLGRLHFKYGDSAFYVHLKRDLDSTAKSYARRKNVGIMNAFASGLLRQKVLDEQARNPLTLATDICETITNNIDHFLLDKTNKMEIHIEDLEKGFSEFWDRISAEGDKEAALASLSKPTNTSQQFEKKNNVGLMTRIKRASRAAYHAFRTPARDSSYFDQRASSNNES